MYFIKNIISYLQNTYCEKNVNFSSPGQILEFSFLTGAEIRRVNPGIGKIFEHHSQTTPYQNIQQTMTRCNHVMSHGNRLTMQRQHYVPLEHSIISNFIHHGRALFTSLTSMIQTFLSEIPMIHKISRQNLDFNSYW